VRVGAGWGGVRVGLGVGVRARLMVRLSHFGTSGIAVPRAVTERRAVVRAAVRGSYKLISSCPYLVCQHDVADPFQVEGLSTVPSGYARHAAAIHSLVVPAFATKLDGVGASNATTTGTASEVPATAVFDPHLASGRTAERGTEHALHVQRPLRQQSDLASSSSHGPTSISVLHRPSCMRLGDVRDPRGTGARVRTSVVLFNC
jgi:hypothetical protein